MRSKIAVLACLVVFSWAFYWTGKAVYAAGFFAGSKQELRSPICWQDEDVPGMLMSFDRKDKKIRVGCPGVVEWRNLQLAGRI